MAEGKDKEVESEKVLSSTIMMAIVLETNHFGQLMLIQLLVFHSFQFRIQNVKNHLGKAIFVL
jgi:hypothetical protein